MLLYLYFIWDDYYTREGDIDFSFICLQMPVNIVHEISHCKYYIVRL